MEQIGWLKRIVSCSLLVAATGCVGTAGESGADYDLAFEDADASTDQSDLTESGFDTPELTSAEVAGLASLFGAAGVGRGVSYRRVNNDGSWNPNGPAHVVTVELCAPGVRMRMTNPFDTSNGAHKLNVQEFGQRVDATAVINGDWWLRDRDPGHPLATRVPRGLARGGGVTFADPPSSDHSSFGVLAVGPGKAMMKPEGSWLSAPEFANYAPFNPASLTDMVSGQPTLVWNGENRSRHNPGHCAVRRARSSVGMDASGTRIIMAVADGRPGISCSGMADLMIRMGAQRAQMQDSGGSAAMYVKGRGITNRVSDGTPRRVVNHIGVVNDGSAVPYSCKTSRGMGVTALKPTRVLDTRIGLGAPRQPFDPWMGLRLRLRGIGGIGPDASAVLLNLTVTQPHGPGWVATKHDGTFSGTSNVNFGPGETRANLVWADLNANGEVELAGHIGTHLVADVVGFMSSGGDGFVPTAGRRALDTRASEALKAGESREILIRGKFGVPGDASGVLVNLTSTQATGAGYLTAYAEGHVPNTSNVNFQRGAATSNAAMLRIAKDGKIRVHATTASTDLVVDVMGYTRAAAPLRYHAVHPTRMVDTRSGLGGHRGPVAGERSWAIGRGVRAVVVNVAAVAPAGHGFTTLFEHDTNRPSSSNLNYAPGQVVAGLAVVPVDSAGRLRLYSLASAHYVIDLVGTFR